jgi:hypothetical protein
MRPFIIEKIRVTGGSNLAKASSPRIPVSCAISKSRRSSVEEPRAVNRNRENSRFDRRAAPSAMFAGIETADLRICEVKPNLSSEGNLLVSRKRSIASCRETLNTSSCSWPNGAVPGATFNVLRFTFYAQRGMFPCFLDGREDRFPSNSLNAAMSFSRVSEGSMISSM